MLFAGLYESGAGPPEFTILTTEASPLIAPVHNRMPVILPSALARAWLDADSPDPLAHDLGRAVTSVELVATPVSARVNSVANDGPDCLAPPSADPPEPQLKLPV
jgi:putative SOS response-associated peptidase YedK